MSTEALRVPRLDAAFVMEPESIMLQLATIPTDAGDEPGEPERTAPVAPKVVQPKPTPPKSTPPRPASLKLAPLEQGNLQPDKPGQVAPWKVGLPRKMVRAAGQQFVWGLTFWTLLLPRSIRPARPVLLTLWILLIGITCVSGAGLIVGPLTSKPGAGDVADAELADEFNHDKSGGLPLSPAATAMQPLSAPSPSQSDGTVNPPLSAPVQSAIYQAPGTPRAPGAWLEGTIIEDEFDAPNTNVNYDPSRPRAQ